MEEYLLKFNKEKDLIIINEEHLSIILALFRNNNINMITLEMHQLIKKMYVQYLIKVINANRYMDGFYYSYITGKFINQDEICMIISIQLKKLTLNNQPCFKKIKCKFNKQGKREILIKCTHFFACKCRRYEGTFVYKSPTGKNILLNSCLYKEKQ